MDKEFITETVLAEDGKSEKLIRENDIIDYKFACELSKAKVANISKAFYIYPKTHRSDIPKYIIDVKCPKCGKIEAKLFSKTKTIESIKAIKAHDVKNNDFWCSECKSNREEIRKEEQKENYVKHKLRDEENTKRYLDNYLGLGRHFSVNAKPWDKINAIFSSWFVNDEIICETVKNMKYKDFLQTPYWDGIRTYKLKKANNCCQLCGSKEKLNVHHKTYENHGKEHFKTISDNDLIVLCHKCHAKFHDKLAKVEDEQ